MFVHLKFEELVCNSTLKYSRIKSCISKNDSYDCHRNLWRSLQWFILLFKNSVGPIPSCHDPDLIVNTIHPSGLVRDGNLQGSDIHQPQQDDKSNIKEHPIGRSFQESGEISISPVLVNDDGEYDDIPDDRVRSALPPILHPTTQHEPKPTPGKPIVKILLLKGRSKRTTTTCQPSPCSRPPARIDLIPRNKSVSPITSESQSDLQPASIQCSNPTATTEATISASPSEDDSKWLPKAVLLLIIVSLVMETLMMLKLSTEYKNSAQTIFDHSKYVHKIVTDLIS